MTSFPSKAATAFGQPARLTRSDSLLSPKRVAVLRALNLGDMLLAVPALRALRGAYPRAEITLIGLAWAEDFARRYGAYVNRFLEFPGFPGIAEVPYDVKRTQCFLREQTDYGYDLAIQLHGDGRTSSSFVRKLHAHLTLGPSSPAGDLFDIRTRYREEDPEIMRALAVVKLLSTAVADTHLEFPLRAADLAEVDAVLAGLSNLSRPSSRSIRRLIQRRDDGRGIDSRCSSKLCFGRQRRRSFCSARPRNPVWRPRLARWRAYRL